MRHVVLVIPPAVERAGKAWELMDARAIVVCADHEQAVLWADAAPAELRAYAVTDTQRVASASDIPTTDEAGLPGFHMTLWSGMWVPKDTPKDIVAKLNAAAVAALNDAGVRKQLENLGLRMPPKDQLSPEALGSWQKAEIAKWWPMIKAANVKVD